MRGASNGGHRSPLLAGLYGRAAHPTSQGFGGSRPVVPISTPHGLLIAVSHIQGGCEPFHYTRPAAATNGHRHEGSSAPFHSPHTPGQRRNLRDHKQTRSLNATAITMPPPPLPRTRPSVFLPEIQTPWCPFLRGRTKTDAGGNPSTTKHLCFMLFGYCFHDATNYIQHRRCPTRPRISHESG